MQRKIADISSGKPRNRRRMQSVAGLMRKTDQRSRQLPQRDFIQPHIAQHIAGLLIEQINVEIIV